MEKAQSAKKGKSKFPLLSKDLNFSLLCILCHSMDQIWYWVYNGWSCQDQQSVIGKKMTMKFLWEGVSYVIKSSSVNPIQDVAMQWLEQDVQGGEQLFAIMKKGEDHVGGSTVPAELQPLLQEFQQVLKEPRTLPPFREFDHRIPLKEGAAPVNVRPYHYAHFQKNEIVR